MIKVLDKDLEAKFLEIIKSNQGGAEKAAEIVATLKTLQDSGGLKLCRAVTQTDSMYREVK